MASIAELLKRPEDRLKRFYLGHRDYDTTTLGFTLKNDGNLDQVCEPISERCFVVNNDGVKEFFDLIDKSEATYKDLTGNGNSNLGHDFGTSLSDTDKQSLIEFLKVLEPDEEYAWKDGTKFYEMNIESRQDFSVTGYCKAAGYDH